MTPEELSEFVDKHELLWDPEHQEFVKPGKRLFDKDLILDRKTKTLVPIEEFIEPTKPMKKTYTSSSFSSSSKKEPEIKKPKVKQEAVTESFFTLTKPKQNKKDKKGKGKAKVEMDEDKKDKVIMVANPNKSKDDKDPKTESLLSRLDNEITRNKIIKSNLMELKVKEMKNDLSDQKKKLKIAKRDVNNEKKRIERELKRENDKLERIEKEKNRLFGVRAEQMKVVVIENMDGHAKEDTASIDNHTKSDVDIITKEKIRQNRINKSERSNLIDTKRRKMYLEKLIVSKYKKERDDCRHNLERDALKSIKQLVDQIVDFKKTVQRKVIKKWFEWLSNENSFMKMLDPSFERVFDYGKTQKQYEEEEKLYKHFVGTNLTFDDVDDIENFVYNPLYSSEEKSLEPIYEEYMLWDEEDGTGESVMKLSYKVKKDEDEAIMLKILQFPEKENVHETLIDT